MEHLRFKNYNELKNFVNGLKFIGEGGDGAVYLLDNKWSLKIFHHWRTSASDIVPFLNLEIDGFAFPKCLVYLDDEVVGVIAPFIKGKDIFRKKLAGEEISKIVTASSALLPGIGELSYLYILAKDAEEVNIIYGDNKLTVIDPLNFEFLSSKNIFAENLKIVMASVVNSALDERTLKINTFLKLINSRYKNYQTDWEQLSHPKELLLGIKGELEEFLQMRIVRFNDAEEPLQRKLIK